MNIFGQSEKWEHVRRFKLKLVGGSKTYLNQFYTVASRNIWGPGALNIDEALSLIKGIFSLYIFT